MTTIRLSPLACGLSLAITTVILYLACALVVIFFPEAMTAGMALLLHGYNLSGLSSPDSELHWNAVAIGTLAMAACAFVTGALFATVHNLIGGRGGTSPTPR